MQPLYRYISWVMNIFGYHAMIKLLLIFCQKGGGGGKNIVLAFPTLENGMGAPPTLGSYAPDFWFHFGFICF